MELVRRQHPWYTMLPFAAILAYLLTLTGYWQLVFVGGLVAGVLVKRPLTSFLVGLVGGLLAWGVPLAIASASYPLSEASALLLRILGLSSGLVLLPYLIAVLISGFSTGLGALCGAYGYELTWAQGGGETS